MVAGLKKLTAVCLVQALLFMSLPVGSGWASDASQFYLKQPATTVSDPSSHDLLEMMGDGMRALDIYHSTREPPSSHSLKSEILQSAEITTLGDGLLFNLPNATRNYFVSRSSVPPMKVLDTLSLGDGYLHVVPKATHVTTLTSDGLEDHSLIGDGITQPQEEMYQIGERIMELLNAVNEVLRNAALYALAKYGDYAIWRPLIQRADVSDIDLSDVHEAIRLLHSKLLRPTQKEEEIDPRHAAYVLDKEERLAYPRSDAANPTETLLRDLLQSVLEQLSPQTPYQPPESLRSATEIETLERHLHILTELFQRITSPPHMDDRRGDGVTGDGISEPAQILPGNDFAPDRVEGEWFYAERVPASDGHGSYYIVHEIKPPPKKSNHPINTEAGYLEGLLRLYPGWLGKFGIVDSQDGLYRTPTSEGIQAHVRRTRESGTDMAIDFYPADGKTTDEEFLHRYAFEGALPMAVQGTEFFHDRALHFFAYTLYPRVLVDQSRAGVRLLLIIKEILESKVANGLKEDPLRKINRDLEDFLWNTLEAGSSYITQYAHDKNYRRVLVHLKSIGASVQRTGASGLEILKMMIAQSEQLNLTLQDLDAAIEVAVSVQKFVDSDYNAQMDYDYDAMLSVIKEKLGVGDGFADIQRIHPDKTASAPYTASVALQSEHMDMERPSSEQVLSELSVEVAQATTVFELTRDLSEEAWGLLTQLQDPIHIATAGPGSAQLVAALDLPRVQALRIVEGTPNAPDEIALEDAQNAAGLISTAPIEIAWGLEAGTLHLVLVDAFYADIADQDHPQVLSVVHIHRSLETAANVLRDLNAPLAKRVVAALIIASAA